MHSNLPTRIRRQLEVRVCLCVLCCVAVFFVCKICESLSLVRPPKGCTQSTPRGKNAKVQQHPAEFHQENPKKMDQITESLNLILRTRRSNACLLRHQILSKITPRLVTPLCCSDQYEGGAAFHDRRSELRGNRFGLFREKGCCGDGNLTPACFPRLEQSNLTSFLVLFLFGSYYGLDPMDHPCPSTKKYLWATVWWLASVFLRPPIFRPPGRSDGLVAQPKGGGVILRGI